MNNSILSCTIKGYLEERRFKYVYDESYQAWIFPLRSEECNITCLFLLQDDAISVVGFSDIKADLAETEKMQQLAKFTNLVNYKILEATLVYDTRSGNFQSRTYVDCTRTLPAWDVLENSIQNIEFALRHYAPGIWGILLHEKTAEEAFALCEENQSFKW